MELAYTDDELKGNILIWLKSQILLKTLSRNDVPVYMYKEFIYLQIFNGVSVK